MRRVLIPESVFREFCSSVKREGEVITGVVSTKQTKSTTNKKYVYLIEFFCELGKVIL